MKTNFFPTDFAKCRLAAELLAYTVQQLFPQVRLLGGGTNSIGFYYDFIFEQVPPDQIIELIEVKLRTLIKENHSIQFLSMMRENAQNFFEHHEQFELAVKAGEEKSNIIELIQLNNFYSLCPQLPFSTIDEVGTIKLLPSLSSTQRLEKEQVIIQRLGGICQPNGQALKQFLKTYENFLKKSDHRQLGPTLNLFSFSPLMSELEATWHPKGLKLREILKEWLQKQRVNASHLIETPLALRQTFLSPALSAKGLDPFEAEGESYQLRPGLGRAHQVFITQQQAFLGESPYRLTEYARVYRHLLPVEKWGLFCTSSYLMETTTTYCTKKELLKELISSLHFIEQIIRIFGFKAHWNSILSRQKKSKRGHESATNAYLKQAFVSYSSFYPVLTTESEEEEQEPYLELLVEDRLGRFWPLSTVRLKGQKEAVFLTCSVWESLDLLIGLLLEQGEGRFPFWLAPEQVRLMIIGEQNRSYGQAVYQRLCQEGLRVTMDQRVDPLSLRIHEAEKEKVPYLVLIGDQEKGRQKIKQRVTDPKRGHTEQWIELEIFLEQLKQAAKAPFLEANKESITGESELA